MISKTIGYNGVYTTFSDKPIWIISGPVIIQLLWFVTCCDPQVDMERDPSLNSRSHHHSNQSKRPRPGFCPLKLATWLWRHFNKTILFFPQHFGPFFHLKIAPFFWGLSLPLIPWDPLRSLETRICHQAQLCTVRSSYASAKRSGRSEHERWVKTWPHRFLSVWWSPKTGEIFPILAQHPQVFLPQKHFLSQVATGWAQSYVGL